MQRGGSDGIPGTPGDGFDLGQALRLLNSISEGVCLVDAGGDIRWSNAVYASLDPGIQSAVITLFRQTLQQAPFGRTEQAAIDVRRVDLASPDEARFFQVEITPFGPVRTESDQPPQGAPTQFVLLLRETTAEIRQRQKIEAIDRAGAELVKIEADAIRKLNAVERLRHLEAKIVKASRDLLHFDHFAIRLLDESSGRLELVISCGLPSTVSEFDLYPLPEGNGISGYVAATGKSYICRDTGRDELFLPGLGGARSSLTVPLRLQDQVIGIMDVESQQVEAFNEDDRRLAEIFARYIAIALHTLDLLVVERTATNLSVSGRVEGELSGPLQDIVHEVDTLHDMVPPDPEVHRHIQRIKADVESIFQRVREVGQGPQTLLGVDRALADTTRDPAMIGRRVLVADDQPRIRRIIGDLLRNRGCEVTLADNGSQAVEILDRVAAGALAPFHLIISDIKMPDRNGYEVFAAARRGSTTVPVILMTGFGYDPHHSIVRASQEGLQAVLFKPFPVERMLEEVRKGLVPPGSA